MTPPKVVLSSHSALDIGHKTVTIAVFHYGKDSVRSLPKTIE